MNLPTDPLEVRCPYCPADPGEPCGRVAPWGPEPWDDDKIHHERREELRMERERVDRESQTGLFSP